MKQMRPIATCAVSLSVAFVMVTADMTPAIAQSNNNLPNILGGILGSILKGAVIDGARKSWTDVDEEVQNCLVSQYRISPAQLVQEGIRADDGRVTPYITACQQMVNTARLRQEDEERTRQAQAQADEQSRLAQAQAEADVRAAQAQAVEDARRVQLAADADLKAQKAAKYHELVAKYGKAVADAISAGTVRMGMTKEQVLAARGNPEGKEVIPPNDELWRYGADRIALSNGRVTYVGH